MECAQQTAVRHILGQRKQFVKNVGMECGEA